jgi:leucyl aminopeptidase
MPPGLFASLGSPCENPPERKHVVARTTTTEELPVKITVQQGEALRVETDALIVPIPAAESEAVFKGIAQEIDEALGGEPARLAREARFTGAVGTRFQIPTMGRLPARRLVLTGIGSRDAVTAETVRRAWGVAVTAARDAGAKQVHSLLPPTSDDLDLQHTITAATAGAQLALYQFRRHWGLVKNETPPKEVESLTFIGAELDEQELKQGIDIGNAIAGAVGLARDLSNEPARDLTPVRVAEIAQELATEHGLEIQIYGPDELREMGADAMVTVGAGSSNPPRLIHLIYRPQGADGSERQIGFVGKCITFDSGGYSIKPTDGMLEMKGDMAGGAAVLGAMTALRQLGVKHVVHGVICAAENMISGDAFRPGDVLTGMNGVTMEIHSTDAEGRLVLADGLVYTARQGAQELIDLATLTGAKIVALGDQTTAIFSNNDQLASRLLGAADSAGELMWRLPLTKDLESQIKGEVADIKNTGGRSGGAITAALFIQHFSEGLPWAHLDIAGANRTAKDRPYTPRGATGVGVRTLLDYLTADPVSTDAD